MTYYIISLIFSLIFIAPLFAAHIDDLAKILISIFIITAVSVLTYFWLDDQFEECNELSIQSVQFEASNDWWLIPDTEFLKKIEKTRYVGFRGKARDILPRIALKKKCAYWIDPTELSIASDDKKIELPRRFYKDPSVRSLRLSNNFSAYPLKNSIIILIRARRSLEHLVVDPELAVVLIDYKRNDFIISACRSKEFWGKRGPWVAENIREARENLSSDALNSCHWVPEIRFSPLDVVNPSNK